MLNLQILTSVGYQYASESPDHQMRWNVELGTAMMPHIG
jgi:hypothetical protein